MPVSTLDSILNVVVPIAALVFLGFVVYKGFKEPIDDFIHWIGGMFGGGGSRAPQQDGYNPAPNYGGRRRTGNPYGMDTGDVSYR